MKTRAYKVFKIRGGTWEEKRQRYSWSPAAATRGLKIFYEVDKEIKPKVGKLFIFKKYEDAARFVNNSNNDWNRFEIWEVEVEGVSDTQQDYILNLWDVDLNNTLEVVDSFWKTKYVGPTFPAASLAPAGTYVCDSLRLVKMVFEGHVEAPTRLEDIPEAALTNI
jgi:hypothetical protein